MILSIRQWGCPACGAKDINRDLNAALNIRKKGVFDLQAVTACGGLHKTRHE